MSKSAIICVDDEVVILDSLKKQLKREFGDRFLNGANAPTSLRDFALLRSTVSLFAGNQQDRAASLYL